MEFSLFSFFSAILAQNPRTPPLFLGRSPAGRLPLPSLSLWRLTVGPTRQVLPLPPTARPWFPLSLCSYRRAAPPPRPQSSLPPRARIISGQSRAPPSPPHFASVFVRKPARNCSRSFKRRPASSLQLEPFLPRFVALVSLLSPPALFPSFCQAKRGLLAPRPRSPEELSAVVHGAAARAFLRPCPSPGHVPLALLSLLVVSVWKAARRSPLAAVSCELGPADNGARRLLPPLRPARRLPPLSLISAFESRPSVSNPVAHDAPYPFGGKLC